MNDGDENKIHVWADYEEFLNVLSATVQQRVDVNELSFPFGQAFG